MSGEARLRHPVEQRVLRCLLQACIDRELQGRRLLLRRYAEGAGDAAERVNRDLRLDEARVEQRVVRRLDAALADHLARLPVLVRVRLQLRRADLTEQA